jgi:hypothetical protein
MAPMETQVQEGPGGTPSGWVGEGGAVQVLQESLSVTRYVIPKRNLGAARHLGWIPLGMGLFAVVFMSFWMHGPINSGLQSEGLGRWVGIVFGLLGLPGLVAGVGIMALGMAILTNALRSEITIGEGMINAIERVGPVPIRRRRLIGQLTRLVVEKGITVTDQTRGAPTLIARDFALLRVEVATGKPLVLALGYPYDMMRSLADTLAATLSLERLSDGVSPRAPVMEVVEREAVVPEMDREVPKPADTDITCLTEPHGLAIEVPAKGLWKGSHGLFFFSLLWNGFMVVFTIGMVKGHPPLPACLFVAAFWAIGLGLMAGSIAMAKRKVLIAVVNDVLAYRVIGAFKQSERRVGFDDIDAIRVGPSGVEVNDRPVTELQIVLAKGGKIGLLSNRSEAEQSWLAQVLRRHLKESQRRKSIRGSIST